MALMLVAGKVEEDGRMRRKFKMIHCDAAVAFAVKDIDDKRVAAWYTTVGADMPASVIARGLISLEADDIVMAAVEHERMKAKWAKVKEEAEHGNADQGGSAGGDLV